MIGPIAKRILEFARMKQRTIKDEAVLYEQDPINRVPTITDEDQNFAGAPSLRFRLRQRMPNPKREL